MKRTKELKLINEWIEKDFHPITGWYTTQREEQLWQSRQRNRVNKKAYQLEYDKRKRHERTKQNSNER